MKKNYDYADDYADDVFNVSGADWPGSHMLPRPRTSTPPRPGQHVSIRRQRVIDAQSGEKLDTELEEGLSLAAQRRLSIRRTVEQAGPSERPMLRHIFGLNLPGRGRA